jgi:hypothetical protein
MNEFDQRWQKLVALARQAPDADAIAIPYGFAVRLAAQAGNRAAPWASLERFALRGLLAAAACCVAAVAFNYFSRSSELSEEVGLDETVVVALDMS